RVYSRHQPVVQRWFLQLDLAVEQVRQAPGVVEQDRLRILGGACLVAAPRAAVAQAMEEKQPAKPKQDQKPGNGAKRATWPRPVRACARVGGRLHSAARTKVKQRQTPGQHP